MERNPRRDDRSGRRDDQRSQRPRYERERSRSPRRDRRDDRHRDRSPPTRAGRGGHPNTQRFDRDRNPPRQPRETPPARSNARPPPTRPSQDARPNGAEPRGKYMRHADVRAAAAAEAVAKPDAEMLDEHADEDEDSEAEMQRVMGFKGFRSTKNTKVPGNEKNFAVSKVKKAEYRQYMNRVGGFNRPLSPSRM